MIKLTPPQGPAVVRFIAEQLRPHHAGARLSKEFSVEQESGRALIRLVYPGKKVIPKTGRMRYPKHPFDFLVESIDDGRWRGRRFGELFDDFVLHKRTSSEFWLCVTAMYRDYTLVHPVPNLPGIPSKEFLLLLKWIGIQEDLNYLGKYQTLLPGFEFRIAKKGVGRKKFFAALVLAKHHDSEFNSEEIKKIAGFY